MKTLSLLTSAAFSFPETVDIHLLIMAGLVMMTALGAATCVALLLLLVPVLYLALGRPSPRRNVPPS